MLFSRKNIVAKKKSQATLFDALSGTSPAQFKPSKPETIAFLPNPTKSETIAKSVTIIDDEISIS